MGHKTSVAMFGSHLNRTRNSGCNPKNFSSDALKAILSAPEKLTGQAKIVGRDPLFWDAGFKKPLIL